MILRRLLDRLRLWRMERRRARRSSIRRCFSTALPRLPTTAFRAGISRFRAIFSASSLLLGRARDKGKTHHPFAPGLGRQREGMPHRGGASAFLP